MKIWWGIGLTAAVFVWWAMRTLNRAHVADWGGYGINLLDGLNRVFCRRFHRLVADPVPLSATGGAIIVANHVSGLDPLLIVAASPRPVRFLIAEEEYNRWWLRWLFRWIGCIPVNRTARGTKAFYPARAALERGEVLGMFPEGGIRNPGDPPKALNRGFLVLARAVAVPVVPVRIGGVSGEGQTISAVFQRSRARLEAGAPVMVHDSGSDEAFEQINSFLQPS